MSEIRVDQNEYYERELPAVPAAALVVALLVLLTSVGAWEYTMRGLGLESWDLGDGPAHWAAERRKIDAGDTDVAIIGASRILFDTDLDVFESVTGIRPVQLALAGTNAQSFLTDLANDEDFGGLLIVGMTELVYFIAPELGLFEGALEYYRSESPSDRIGHEIYLQLQRFFAFIEPEYSLTRLVYRLPVQTRDGTFGPYDEVWKISTTEPDRQTRMWHRIESPGPLVDHARHAWIADFEYYNADYLKGYQPGNVAKVIDAARRDIEKIRSRGGEVVFVRCPSSDFYRRVEREHIARTRVYDRLIEETNTLGLHFEDYPALQGLSLPEWSHLSADAARAFTRAYAGELVKQSPWLKVRMAKRNESPGQGD